MQNRRFPSPRLLQCSFPRPRPRVLSTETQTQDLIPVAYPIVIQEFIVKIFPGWSPQHESPLHFCVACVSTCASGCSARTVSGRSQVAAASASPVGTLDGRARERYAHGSCCGCARDIGTPSRLWTSWSNLVSAAAIHLISCGASAAPRSAPHSLYM